MTSFLADIAQMKRRIEVRLDTFLPVDQTNKKGSISPIEAGVLVENPGQTEKC